jgi:hypothetical protein
MGLLRAAGKFLTCLFLYLFWGQSWVTGAAKIVGWVFVTFFSIKESDKLTIALEGKGAAVNLPSGTWILVVLGGGLVLSAIGASCVRVKSLLFKVADQMELDDSSGIFRLPVLRRGWFVNAEAPRASVEKVVNERGEEVFRAAPFELIWSHQHPLGKRPPLSGPVAKIDVLIAVHDTPLTAVLSFCGINGNRIPVYPEFSHRKAPGKLWVQISVAESVRWFAIEHTPGSKWRYQVTAEVPPGLRRGSRRRI